MSECFASFSDIWGQASPPYSYTAWASKSLSDFVSEAVSASSFLVALVRLALDMTIRPIWCSDPGGQGWR
jgi:hypothetical protein